MNENLNPESVYTIKTAALALGLSQMYVRRECCLTPSRQVIRSAPRIV